MAAGIGKEFEVKANIPKGDQASIILTLVVYAYNAQDLNQRNFSIPSSQLVYILMRCYS